MLSAETNLIGDLDKCPNPMSNHSLHPAKTAFRLGILPLLFPLYSSSSPKPLRPMATNLFSDWPMDRNSWYLKYRLRRVTRTRWSSTACVLSCLESSSSSTTTRSPPITGWYDDNSDEDVDDGGGSDNDGGGDINDDDDDDEMAMKVMLTGDEVPV